MKKIWKADIMMWVTISIIIIIISLISTHINNKEIYEYEQRSNQVAEIEKSTEELQRDNPDLYIPFDYYTVYKEAGMIADKIEIKDYKISTDFKKINYTLKNNYDFDIFITPELTDEINDTEISSLQLIYYDFSSAYKILKPGEEIELQINTTSVEREKVNKNEFKAHRLIFMNNEDKDVIGYVQIGGTNDEK